MEIVVLGAGSLGSLVGGLCAREHRVTLVGRDPHIGAVRDSGLHVGGAFDFTVHPAARTDPPPTTDLALVTVKAFDTEAAARDLADCDLDAVCSLQNGLGNEEVLATHLDGVLAGTCTYGARLVEPGRVECTGIGETALARVPNGALSNGPLAGIAREAARETARVAREQGVDLGDEAAVAALDGVVEATAANTSSMLQDVNAGRRTEIDAINGAVLDRAGRPVPVNRTLAGLVRAWEAGDR